MEPIHLTSGTALAMAENFWRIVAAQAPSPLPQRLRIRVGAEWGALAVTSTADPRDTFASATWPPLWQLDDDMFNDDGDEYWDEHAEEQTALRWEAEVRTMVAALKATGAKLMPGVAIRCKDLDAQTLAEWRFPPPPSPSRHP